MNRLSCLIRGYIRPLLFLLLLAAVFLAYAGEQFVLAAGVDPARIEEWTKILPAKPRGVGPIIGDRAAWEGVKSRSPQWKDVVDTAEELIGKPLPEVTDDLYLEFSRNGNRRRCEAVMGERQRRFRLLVTAECLENEGRFLAEIERTAKAILAEKTWLLPAHDRGLTNFKGTEITIDLFSSGAAWQLATADYWLGERLSSELRKKIAAELERRIFGPFAGMIKNGKPAQWWLTSTNNWNAVCLANVTGAALTTIESPRRRAFFAAAAEKYIEHFLSGFTPDGYCSEGLGYWNYGFGHFVLLAETLYQQSGGRVDLWNSGTPDERAKLRRIARFGEKMEITPGVYAAFADCKLGSQPMAYFTAYLDRRLSLGRSGEECPLIPVNATTSSLITLGVFAFENSACRQPAAAKSSREADATVWYPDAGVLICRPGGKEKSSSSEKCRMGVAIKGGHNAEHHNHNDVGTFMVAVGNCIPLVDPGGEVYTRRTFSGERYKSGVLNSWGHPVPLVAGKMQRTGRTAAAKVLATKFEEETDAVTFDLRSAYDVKSLKKLERTFVYSRAGEGSLRVTDSVQFDGPQQFETALITFDKWEQASMQSAEGMKREINSLRLRVGKGEGTVEVLVECKESPLALRAEEIDEDMPGGKKPTRLGIVLTEPVEGASVRMTIHPAR